MTWKGVVREINREIKRQQREHEKRARIEAKLEAIEDAKNEVMTFENFLEYLKSLHVGQKKDFDWKKICNIKC